MEKITASEAYTNAVDAVNDTSESHLRKIYNSIKTESLKGAFILFYPVSGYMSEKTMRTIANDLRQSGFRCDVANGDIQVSWGWRKYN